MATTNDQDETWEEFYKTNQSIPVHPSRITTENGRSGQPYCFCLNVTSLELNCKSEEGTDFQLRATFYDAANHYFFGSSWIGPIVKSESISPGKHVVNFQEAIYFHTTINDVTIALVFELVDAANPALETVGWTWLRIFSYYDAMTDINETAQPQERKLDFYHGSPLGLLQIPEPLEEFYQLRKVNMCMMLYTLQSHEQMESVISFIPQNVPISGDDIIPGIEENTDDDSIIDILRSPIPLRTWPCHLNKLILTLPPSIDRFEEYLCTVLNNERLQKDELQPDGSIVKIAERKLKVGVHNGWQFVQPPHIVYLEKDTNQPSPNKFKRSMSRQNSRPESSLSNYGTNCVGLMLRSRLELNEMVHHPLFAIVFLLEYVVNIPVSQPDIPGGKKVKSKLGSSFGSIPLAKKISIGIRVATWSPFQNGMLTNQTVTLDLKSFLPNNPFDQMVFTSDLQLDDMSLNLHSTLCTKSRINVTSTSRATIPTSIAVLSLLFDKELALVPADKKHYVFV